MSTRNVTLPDHLDHYIDEGIASGRFTDASDAVREALSLMEESEQAKVEWMRSAVQEGIDAIERGDYVTLRSGKEIKDFVRQIGEEVEVELATEQDRGR